jgi:hypothetical protein
MIFLLVGGLGGTWTSALIARKFVIWYNQPGQAMAQCNCHELASSATGDLLHWQFIGLLIGTALGVILYLVQWRLFQKSTRTPTGQPPGQTVSPA